MTAPASVIKLTDNNVHDFLHKGAGWNIAQAAVICIKLHNCLCSPPPRGQRWFMNRLANAGEPEYNAVGGGGEQDNRYGKGMTYPLIHLKWNDSNKTIKQLFDKTSFFLMRIINWRKDKICKLKLVQYSLEVVRLMSICLGCQYVWGLSNCSSGCLHLLT